MPRVCTICQHPDRDAIDRALVGGQVESKIAALFRVSADSLARHRANGHIRDALVKAQEAADVDHGIDLHQQLRAANSLAWHVAKQAKEAGDGDLALKALDRVLKQLELVAELAEAIDRRPVVNIYTSPEWIALQAVIVGALDRYPDARRAVLLSLEAPSGR